MKSYADEIAKSMHDSFILKTAKARNFSREDEALNRIANAWKILENIGLTKDADAVSKALSKLGENDV